MLFDVWMTLYAAWSSLGICFDIFNLKGMLTQTYMLASKSGEAYLEFMGLSAPTGATGAVHIPNQTILVGPPRGC
jgi:hypothetical protein